MYLPNQDVLHHPILAVPNTLTLVPSTATCLTNSMPPNTHIQVADPFASMAGFDDDGQPDAGWTPNVVHTQAAHTQAEQEHVQAQTELSPPRPVLDAEVWASFCYDLLLAPDAHVRVCADYSITENDLSLLLDNPAFKARLRECRAHVQSMGPNAGFILMARMLAEKHVATLGQLASDIKIAPAVRLRAIENMTRYAHLDPSTTPPEKREPGTQGSSGGALVQLIFNGSLKREITAVVDGQAQEIPHG